VTVPYAARVQLYPPEDEHLRLETCRGEYYFMKNNNWCIKLVINIYSAMIYVIQVCRQLLSMTRMELQCHPGHARTVRKM